jgi:hypothetical protein
MAPQHERLDLAVDSRREELAGNVAGYADVAAEAIRALNHASITRRPPLPAPDLYPVLGTLARMAHGLAQTGEQLGEHLGDSAHMYVLCQADGSAPRAATAKGRGDLAHAAHCARLLGRTFADAQAAIAAQGYVAPDQEKS